MKIKPCPFCGGEGIIKVFMEQEYISAMHTKKCKFEPDTWIFSSYPLWKQLKIWNNRWKG